MRCIVCQLLDENERPVPPKPDRGTLGELGRLDGVVDRLVVGVVVRVNAGRDQELLLLVRIQPLFPHERRGWHGCVSVAFGTAGATAAGGLAGVGQSRDGASA
jgi:hypothetical protein